MLLGSSHGMIAIHYQWLSLPFQVRRGCIQCACEAWRGCATQLADTVALKATHCKAQAIALQQQESYPAIAKLISSGKRLVSTNLKEVLEIACSYFLHCRYII